MLLTIPLTKSLAAGGPGHDVSQEMRDGHGRWTRGGTVSTGEGAGATSENYAVSGVSPDAWIARITGPDPSYGLARQFLPRNGTAGRKRADYDWDIPLTEGAVYQYGNLPAYGQGGFWKIEGGKRVDSSKQEAHQLVAPPPPPAAAGFPALTGTPAQVTWAGQIRAAAVRDVLPKIEAGLASTQMALPGLSVIRRRLERAKQFIESEVSVRQWIDRKDALRDPAEFLTGFGKILKTGGDPWMPSRNGWQAHAEVDGIGDRAGRGQRKARIEGYVTALATGRWSWAVRWHPPGGYSSPVEIKGETDKAQEAADAAYAAFPQLVDEVRDYTARHLISGAPPPQPASLVPEMKWGTTTEGLLSWTPPAGAAAPAAPAVPTPAPPAPLETTPAAGPVTQTAAPQGQYLKWTQVLNGFAKWGSTDGIGDRWYLVQSGSGNWQVWQMAAALHASGSGAGAAQRVKTGFKTLQAAADFAESQAKTTPAGIIGGILARAPQATPPVPLAPPVAPAPDPAPASPAVVPPAAAPATLIGSLTWSRVNATNIQATGPHGEALLIRRNAHTRKYQLLVNGSATGPAVDTPREAREAAGALGTAGPAPVAPPAPATGPAMQFTRTNATTQVATDADGNAWTIRRNAHVGEYRVTRNGQTHGDAFKTAEEARQAARAAAE